MALPRGPTNVAMNLAPPNFVDPFPTHEGAFTALQHWARDHGYAVTRHRPSNYANGVPRRYEIVCAFGGTPYTSKSNGIRKSSTRKTNCPFKVKLVQQRILGDLWATTVMCAHHNHGPTDPVSFREHRRMQPQHVRGVEAHAGEAHTREPGATAHAIRASLQANNPGPPVTEHDVWNMRGRSPQDSSESPPAAATTSQAGQPRSRRRRQPQNTDAPASGAAAAAALAASIGNNIIALIDMRLAQYLPPPAGSSAGPSQPPSVPPSDMSTLPISSHLAALVDLRLAQYLTPPSSTLSQPLVQPTSQPPSQAPVQPPTQLPTHEAISQATEMAAFQTNLIWQEPNLGPSATQGPM
ncbi:hypothetical protein G7Z17_g2029 [Cylindrodendrum hubeiense]|uniref:FAR1 domain-containing protein n=1 Tax=Cylindrodendrum hubeiense TaxID=595255 RepID=A0A9P5HLK5_9HYPO|nr:hypothetical protein G7Z17_g2029 [Cylindrodendrum hubeiense]